MLQMKKEVQNEMTLAKSWTQHLCLQDEVLPCQQSGQGSTGSSFQFTSKQVHVECRAYKYSVHLNL